MPKSYEEPSIRKIEAVPTSRIILTVAMGRVAGNALRKYGGTGTKPRVLRAIDHVVSPRISTLEPLAPEEHHEIEGMIAKTKLWHGTGRYQYRDGSPIDVLEGIVKQGSLQPHADPFDTTGPMQTVSLARSRIYSRAYADMHLNRSESQPERHGSALFWANAFLGDFALESAKEEGGLRKAGDHLKANGSREWHSKITKDKLSVLGSFRLGSDIPGNYPILFGVADAQPVQTSRAIATHEVRSGDPIDVDTQITHVEVPEEMIPQTRVIFERYGRADIPILAIEDFERYAAALPVSELMSGTS